MNLSIIKKMVKRVLEINNACFKIYVVISAYTYLIINQLADDQFENSKTMSEFIFVFIAISAALWLFSNLHKIKGALSRVYKRNWQQDQIFKKIILWLAIFYSVLILIKELDNPAESLIALFLLTMAVIAYYFHYYFFIAMFAIGCGLLIYFKLEIFGWPSIIMAIVIVPVIFLTSTLAFKEK